MNRESRQEIRFCTAEDGVRIAYAIAGEGPPLVKAANWLSHLELDWESPIWRHLIRELIRDFTLIRYDERGNGLSDWDVDDLSFESFVRDLEAVIDAAGLERFSLLGISQGCAVSVAYAVRHPERVDRLVLHGGYAVGGTRRSEEERRRREALLTLARDGWGQDNPAFRQAFTSLYLPDADPEELEAWNELQRVATPVENALALFDTFHGIDVSELLPRVTAPTLVMHCRGEMGVPLSAGRQLAANIPRARMVTLDSRNHLVMEHEPAWPRFLRELRSFLGAEASRGRRGPPGYRLEEPLATGGMGTVYRARDLALDREVAVKLLPDELAGKRERLERLRREARLLAALDHPNIATVHGLEEWEGEVFMVMELVRGDTLRKRLADGALSLVESLDVCRQVADALQAAHCRGIVHRDLKPSNVMLTARGVKVLDFGIAKVVSVTGAVEPGGALDRAETLTATGTLLGTGPYMSPEQVRGQDVGPATDLWALGCVLFECLAGRSPFSRETLGDTLAAVLVDRPDFDAVPADVGYPVLSLLGHLLEKDPAVRMSDAGDLAIRLEELLVGR